MTEISDLSERVRELEKHSHPPVSFISCPVCGGVASEEYFLGHLEWHVELNHLSESDSHAIEVQFRDVLSEKVPQKVGESSPDSLRDPGRGGQTS